MPRKVDHGQRRREITAALARITVKGGLEAATFRQVAAEARVSVNLVQYYFGSKDELLLAAQRHVAERVGRRFRAARLAVGEDAPPSDTIRAGLGVFLPRDAESRETTLLFVAFFVAALTNPTLYRPEAREVPDRLHGFLAEQIRRARAAGEVSHGVDPEREATILALLAAGLGQSILGGIHTPDAAADLVDYALTRLFGPDASAASRRGPNLTNIH
ncbi:MAG: TetR/AcrR family transcriptional regulator [Acidimicrobiales bacterium]